ncbi:MAG: hypothetical protein ACI80S_001181 [Pseudohongiellaceae bacterium]|jgi:hypothetical protein
MALVDNFNKEAAVYSGKESGTLLRAHTLIVNAAANL